MAFARGAQGTVDVGQHITRQKSGTTLYSSTLLGLDKPALKKEAHSQPLRHVKRAAELHAPSRQRFYDERTRAGTIRGSGLIPFLVQSVQATATSKYLLAILKVVQFVQSLARYTWIYLTRSLRNVLPYIDSTGDL
ncbi:hypothetical protein BDDG_09710 [Blastomyces dermatitidis ATCC 18188]|uniref:Uncharacterized protein n=1 Tax=Ajellomyces dermatitidis (strain ATCC 18188 / CBS 674.68) TaxID=653446 RepID=F2TU47_AJEDA|nr:hypothetical protein BDDG_09710 [Blastomyces dermatitidis ATCC 18188]